MSKRLTFITKKYPYSFLYESLHRPEILLSFLKLEEENTQFIPEIMHGMSCSCTKLKLTTNYYLRFEEASARLAAGDSLSSFEDIPSSRIVIFPLLPGIKINRSCISLKHLSDKVKLHPIWKISDIINLPEEQLKCSLWFIDGSEKVSFPFNYLTQTSYSMAVLVINSGKDSIGKIINFSGNRINSVALRIQSNSDFTLSDAKKRFKILKRHYRIDPNKCAAFIFGDSPCKCNFPDIYSAFEETFPEVPLLLYAGTLWFGVGMNFSDISFKITPESNFLHLFTFNPMDIMIILIWFNSI